MGLEREGERERNREKEKERKREKEREKEKEITRDKERLSRVESYPKKTRRQRPTRTNHHPCHCPTPINITLAAKK